MSLHSRQVAICPYVLARGTAGYQRSDHTLFSLLTWQHVIGRKKSCSELYHPAQRTYTRVHEAAAQPARAHKATCPSRGLLLLCGRCYGDARARVMLFPSYLIVLLYHTHPGFTRACTGCAAITVRPLEVMQYTSACYFTSVMAEVSECTLFLFRCYGALEVTKDVHTELTRTSSVFELFFCTRFVAAV